MLRLYPKKFASNVSEFLTVSLCEVVKCNQRTKFLTMENFMKKILFGMFLLFVSHSAFSTELKDNQAYAELGYVGLTYKENSYSLSPTNLRLIVGKNEGNFGYEGLLSMNLSGGSTTVSGTNVTYKVNYIYGVYGKALTQIGNDLELFGRLGIAGFDGTASSGAVSLSNNGRGLSYGAGAKYKISKDFNLNLDYMVYYPTKNGVSLSGFTIGAGMHF
jgi:hypothetical protein